jgi:hypothetical protein
LLLWAGIKKYTNSLTEEGGYVNFKSSDAREFIDDFKLLKSGYRIP